MRSTAGCRRGGGLGLFLSLLLLSQLQVKAQDAPPGSLISYISVSAGAGRFPLITGGLAAPLLVSGADYHGVLRVARNLQADLGRVAGKAPALITDTVPTRGSFIVAGTIGKSPLIDRLVREGKLDVSRIAGRWETFALQVVPRPFAGVDQALVIVGSDKRGTIFGMYDLSAQIGVSPWYWWADVPVQRRPQLYVLPGLHTQGEPTVKYRGFFINDEAPALSGWVAKNYGLFNSQFYEKVFELLLRMKGNYLWPAMWGRAFNDDDKLSPQLADELGVVMGTSHHEPMLRAQAEWRRYGKGAWNYETNSDSLRAFWRQGIVTMGAHESIVTVGMRGDGDLAMSPTANIALLERIVSDQRKIIGEVTGKDPSQTPQLWALYKEVQEYYDRGMRVPDDVTLLFADDNWGNIRRLPRVGASGRSGGYGVYYHYDYVGGPRNYKWINTNQIERVYDQMHLAYNLGATRIWIVNVGDIKPMEFPLQFFLDYAWNPGKWDSKRVTQYTTEWAAEQFGRTNAQAIARLLEGYTRFNSRRKPELLSPETYSLVNYREAERVLAEYRALSAEAERLTRLIPVAQRAAFYQLVLYPVQASANINELYITVARNRLYAAQGRAATNELATRAEALFKRDAEMSAFYNDTLAGGKWSHMMDQTRIGYTNWQEPPRNSMPAVRRIDLPAGPEMGIAIEGSARWWPNEPAAATLPEIDSYARQDRYVEVFNRGQAPFVYTARSRVPWLRIANGTATVSDQQRIGISVDWARVPAGSHMAELAIRGAGKSVTVTVPVVKRSEAVSGFVESNGYVAMEAEHYSRAVGTQGVEWTTIPNLGRTMSAVTARPVSQRVTNPGGNTPRLEYELHLFSTGDSARVNTYVSPTLDFNDHKGLRYGISIDDEPVQVVNVWPDTSLRAWERAVGNNVITSSSRHKLNARGRHVLKFWLMDPGVVLQKIVVDAGGLMPSYLGPPESYRVAAKRGPRSQARFDYFSYTGSDPVYHTTRASAAQFLNPILPGFYPDPSICRLGDDYYLVTSTFGYWPGVPVFQSRDLVSWKQVGNVLDRPWQANLDTLGISRGVFAPSISCHDQKLWVINTLVDAGGNFVSTASNPAGPWSDPVYLGFDGIDPALFFDDDGRAWVLNNGPPIGQPLYEGHRAIWIQEFDPRAMKMIGERKLIVNGGTDIAKKPIWIEGPHIVKVDATYYLIAAEGGTAEDHSEVVFRSKSVLGPWEPFGGNPILTQRHLSAARQFPITSTGHADFVQTPSGEWWAVFLGARPYKADFYNTGRETFMLPVRWVEGWPRILDGDATVPYAVNRPSLPAAAQPDASKSGNFTQRDDFALPDLPIHYNFMRTLREQWYDLTSKPGWLTIDARPAHIGQRAQPSFIGRRQQHAYATVSTAMQFTAQADGDKAGLVAFQTDDNYYALVIARQNGRQVIQLERSEAHGKITVLASAPLNATTTHLKIVARGDQYDFAYATLPDKWITLMRGVDGTFLSTKVAGGFIGTFFGMYAYSPN